MYKQLTDDLGIERKRVKRIAFLLDDFKKEIIHKYSDNKDIDIINHIEYLKTHDISIFNNEKMNKMADRVRFEIEYDDKSGLLFSYWNEKKIYLKRSFNQKMAESYLRSIFIEQMHESPHSYKQVGYDISNGDVVVDIGAAEGFFSLDCIDIAKKVYIIECDEEWIEALEYTFLPYKEKTIIIPKKIGSVSDAEYITLDEINNIELINFIKMDIEGAEYEALCGAEKVLQMDGVKMLICTYHNSEDAGIISSVLLENHFQVGFTRGYMVFLFEENMIPEFRHGVLFATKINNIGLK